MHDMSNDHVATAPAYVAGRPGVSHSGARAASGGAARAWLTIVLALASACQDNARQDSGHRPYTGRLIAKLTMSLSLDDLAALTSDDLAVLASQGVKFDADTSTLVFQEMALGGRWVKLADQFVMSDANGLFRIADLPTNAKDVEVFRSILDSAPDQIFPLDRTGFLATGSGAPTYAKTYQVHTPGNMNKTDTAGTNSDGCPGHCIATRGATMGCCLDYDGPYGDGRPISRETISPSCLGNALLNFFRSTCYQWSFGPLGDACLNESAYWCQLDPETFCPFPSCWENHRYRNCQDLDATDFHVTPQTTTVCAGQSIALSIHNNTVANETVLANPANVGSLSVVGSGPSMASAYGLNILMHYNIEKQRHYVDATVAYTAPPASQLPSPPDVTLFGQAAAITQNIQIHIDGSPGCRPDGNGIAVPAPPKTVGTSLGDPHLMTFDRVRYDAQAVGELILARDKVDGTQIQVRTRPLTSRVAVNAAVATSVGTDVVAFYASGTVRLNHVATNIPQGKTTLNGGALYRTGDAYVVVWPDNSQLRVRPNGSFVRNVQFYAADGRQSRMEGLLGNFDGSLVDDIATRAGNALTAPISFADFYHTYLESWRISQEESLFDYGPGETTETFTDRSFPPEPATTQSLSDADRASASAICQAASVAADWFDACVLDVALSGTADLAGEFAAAPASDTSIDPTGGNMAPPSGGNVPPGTCVATGSMTAARLGFEARAVTLSNGKILVAGGLDTSTGHVLASAEIYDPATGTFSPAGSTSKPRIRFALVTLGNGKVLAAGGLNDAGTVEASADIYDPVQNTWAPTGNMAVARVDFNGAALQDGRALVVAGVGQVSGFDRRTGVLTGGSSLKGAEIYDPRSGTFAATGATATAGTTMFAVSPRLDGSIFAATAGTGEVYSRITGQFTSIGALPTMITGAGAFAFTLPSGDIFVLPALALSDALTPSTVGGPVLVNPSTNRFTSLANDTIGGTSAAIRLVTGDVFIVGGQRSGAATAETQVYRIASAAWQAPGATTVVRHGPILANLPNGAVLVMGGCQTNACGNTVLNTAEICNPAPLP